MTEDKTLSELIEMIKDSDNQQTEEQYMVVNPQVMEMINMPNPQNTPPSPKRYTPVEQYIRDAIMRCYGLQVKSDK